MSYFAILEERYHWGNAHPYCFSVKWRSHQAITTLRYAKFTADLSEIEAWCAEQFGETCAAACWYRDFLEFNFSHEVDAVAFKLRWG